MEQLISPIDAKGGLGVGPTPTQTFEKIVNQNSIKPKIEDFPGNFLQKLLTPPSRTLTTKI
jgi:hypothetical protein